MSSDENSYNASDSDEDYEENEKILLQKVRNRHQSDDEDSEKEVLSVGAPDSDQSDIALSDVEGQDKDDDLPDIRAWGKNRKAFYSTDYVDQDYGGLHGQNADAEMEEDEVNVWEKDLQQQLADADFSGIVPSTAIDKKEVKVDKDTRLDQSKDLKDFYLIIDLYKGTVQNVLEYLKPVVTKYKKGQIPNGLAMDFVNMMYETSLNFCTNVSMYLLLKASQIDLKKHPIIKRLNQYRQILDQILPTFDDVIKPQIILLLDKKAVNTKDSKKTLKLLQKLSQTKSAKPQNIELPSNISAKMEIVEEANRDEEIETNQVLSKEPEKRPINYQIAKNKGLTPHRKKEQRNPRVKHRNKFRKANIRRKGAVRQPRTELQRYGGEISGIKASVSKSVKIKS